jgi:hypothetical protein
MDKELKIAYFFLAKVSKAETREALLSAQQDIKNYYRDYQPIKVK